ncbi:hypothetical protein SAMN04488569_102037 [Marinilactibacillus piezotolerans]|uniref:Uncharacterized protein n=1 Tax=Marinilactibacillus piezotolerans TaxID=258723 RepID=A0A1I3YAA7_9LACT|nr:hypothetical protein SAMN04488569_102037 [Marinilactibacillus piezotolerans]
MTTEYNVKFYTNRRGQQGNLLADIFLLIIP